VLLSSSLAPTAKRPTKHRLADSDLGTLRTSGPLQRREHAQILTILDGRRLMVVDACMHGVACVWQGILVGRSLFNRLGRQMYLYLSRAHKCAALA
jgi:hypothetical protein